MCGRCMCSSCTSSCPIVVDELAAGHGIAAGVHGHTLEHVGVILRRPLDRADGDAHFMDEGVFTAGPAAVSTGQPSSSSTDRSVSRNCASSSITRIGCIRHLGL